MQLFQTARRLRAVHRRHRDVHHDDIGAQAFGRGQLSGSPISATPGHLMVVRGFTKGGDVLVNDPAGRTNSQVRRTYDRAQFERAWLKGSGGVVYVIAPRNKRLAF